MCILTGEFILICPSVNIKWSCQGSSKESKPMFLSYGSTPLPNAEHLGKEVAMRLICWPSPLRLPNWPRCCTTSQIKHDGQSIKASVCCWTDSRLSQRCLSVVEACQKKRQKLICHGHCSLLMISHDESGMGCRCVIHMLAQGIQHNGLLMHDTEPLFRSVLLNKHHHRRYGCLVYMTSLVLSDGPYGINLIWPQLKVTGTST